MVVGDYVWGRCDRGDASIAPLTRPIQQTASYLMSTATPTAPDAINPFLEHHEYGYAVSRLGRDRDLSCSSPEKLGRYHRALKEPINLRKYKATNIYHLFLLSFRLPRIVLLLYLRNYTDSCYIRDAPTHMCFSL